MRNLTLRPTQSGYFFSNSGYFSNFQKEEGETSPSLPLASYDPELIIKKEAVRFYKKTEGNYFCDSFLLLFLTINLQ